MKTQSVFSKMWRSDQINALICTKPIGFEIGDILFSYFEHDDKYCLNGVVQLKSEVAIEHGQVFTSFIDTNGDPVNGVPTGTEIHLGLERDGVLYELKYDKITNMYNNQELDTLIAGGPLSIWKIHNLHIYDTLDKELDTVPYYYEYYSQPPEIPETEINYEDVLPGDEVRIHGFKPRHVESFNFKLTKGFGEIFRDGLYTWRYRVHKDDLIDGNVDIEVHTYNYPYYEVEEESTFNCELNLKGAESGSQFEDLTKSQWYSLIKYYLEFSFDGEKELGLKYLKKRSTWSDKNIPPLKIEIYTTKNKYIPPKLTHTEFISDLKPNFTYQLIDGIETGYMKIRTTEHGYNWVFRFNKGVIIPIKKVVEPTPMPEIETKPIDTTKYDTVLYDGEHVALATKGLEYVLINKTNVNISMTLKAKKDSRVATIMGIGLKPYSEGSRKIHTYYLRNFDKFFIEWDSNKYDDIGGEFEFTIPIG